MEEEKEGTKKSQVKTDLPFITQLLSAIKFLKSSTTTTTTTTAASATTTTNNEQK